jgi:hypothetical protein
MNEELVPALTYRADESAVTELDYLDLMHPSGNATAFGSRTAWLLLVRKTVDRAMRCAPHVYLFGINMHFAPT